MINAKDDFTYTGVDNLEVMLEAVRYNTFLTDLVLRHRKGEAAVLDFGAGIGTFSSMIRDRGVEVDCLEVDAFQCGILRDKGFTVFETTAAIPDESYEFIFSLNVFEHIEHDLAAMQECARILKPGGVVLTYVPAFQILFGDMDRKVEHYRRYTRKSLAALAREAGLDLKRTEYVDIAGYFASLLYNMLSKGSGDIDRGSIRFYDSYVFPVSRVIDSLTHGFIGKNAFSIATKPS
jgi:SAM-dependent methyltransferase